MKKLKKFLFAAFTVAILSCLFCQPAFAAISESDVQTQVDAVGKEAVSGNVFIWFLCAIGFLKVGQKIDSFLSSLGVNVGHTGGSMLAEAITIEEGSREFDLVKRDAQGNILNSVVHLLTRPSENPALNINQDFLLERVLRKHPDVIGVGEMRSAAESLSAAESSRTGHTVCTTIHSNSCNSTYRRMMTLAKRKYNMDDSILMQIMV